MQISNRGSEAAPQIEIKDSDFDGSRETAPILGNMYQYHLFPMLFIFLLISFAALWDDMLFKILGRHRRVKAAMLGVANLLIGITIEDFAWFMNRYLLPFVDDPKGNKLMQFSDWTSLHLGAIDVGTFVIPNWYFVGIGLATLAFYGAFRKHDKLS